MQQAVRTSGERVREPRWVRSPTQATYPSGRIKTAVGAATPARQPNRERARQTAPDSGCASCNSWDGRLFRPDRIASRGFLGLFVGSRWAALPDAFFDLLSLLGLLEFLLSDFAQFAGDSDLRRRGLVLGIRLPDSFRAVSFTFGHDASSLKGRLSLAFAQQATAHVASRLSEGRLPSNQPRAQLRSMLVQRVQGHFRTKALRFLRRSARS